MLNITFLSISLRTSCGTISSALCSAVRVIPIRCESARRSPAAALLTNCFTEASSLVIIVRLPFSLMTTFSRNVFSKTVAKLSRPFGRPRGLPDVPFLNLECTGGVPYPTEFATPCVGLLLFDMAHLFHLIEGASSFPVNRASASEGLPATDGNVHIDRVQFDSIADSADPLSCDNCRSATQERVQNNVRTRCAVQNGVGHQSHRFNCGMQQRQIAFFSWSGERIHPRILPDVGAVPSILTQLNVVPVFVFAILENEYQLMLTAVKRSLPAGVFDPDAHVFELRIHRSGSCEEFPDVAPIDENEV